MAGSAGSDEAVSPRLQPDPPGPGRSVPDGRRLLLLGVELAHVDVRLLAGDAAEGHDVGLGVAAEAVAAVDAAGDFTTTLRANLNNQ